MRQGNVGDTAVPVDAARQLLDSLVRRYGPPMRDADVAHGIRHVKVFLATGERAEFDRAREPSRCECGRTR